MAQIINKLPINNHTMAKTILLDFWGTLVENGIWSPIKQVKRILNIHAQFSEYVIRMEKVMMTKTFPSLKEAFQAVAEEFNIQPDEAQLDELVGMWNKSWMLSQPYDETKEILQRLKDEGNTLILISNSDSVSITNALEKHDLKKFFDEVYLSFEIGMIKSDPAFLNKVLKDKNKETSILIGDSIHSDMESAEKAGIMGILIDRRGTRTYKNKIKSLKELQ